MRAPQYGKVRQRMPVGPNPALLKGLRVAPFAKIFALVDGLGCISLHQTEAEAQTALEGEIERRARLSAEAKRRAAAAEADQAHEAKADR